MRFISFAGLALATLMCTNAAFACDTVLPTTQRDINSPGKYCLSANRTQPIHISGDNIELDCRGKSIVDTSQGANGPIGIMAVSNGNVTVRNCRIESFLEGIHLRSRGGDQLVNNTIVQPREGGIMVFGEYANDPEAVAPRLTSNRVVDYGNQQQTGPGRRAAIEAMMVPRAVFASNVVVGYRDGAGVVVDNSADVQLNANQFLDFPDNTWRIVELRQSPRARLAHNSIMLRQRGGTQGVIGAAGATCIENVAINTARSGFADCAVTRYNVEEPAPFFP